MPFRVDQGLIYLYLSEYMYLWNIIGKKTKAQKDWIVKTNDA